MAQQNVPVFFVSYVRHDFKHPAFAQYLKTFIADVEAQVAQDLGRAPEGVAFIEVDDLQVGELWTPGLANALESCMVGVPLYTKSYFTRPWCGKEFQVFLDRAGQGPGPTGIVPVRWGRLLQELPECAAKIQFSNGSFPAEYVEMGMQQLLALKAALPAKYDLAVQAVAAGIVDAAINGPLNAIGAVDFDKVVSAWDTAVAADPKSHTKGNISKTCFVYVARDGWSWQPYEGTPANIGAIAQLISGELGVQYEEIKCDTTLPAKLQEANDNDVPTVLFGDPSSFADQKIAQPMKQYDRQYLLNCATLVPWDSEAKDAIDADPRWIQLSGVCHQKVADPPPNHDWRSIFSRSDLQLKTKVAIEKIRSRLMKQLVAEPSGPGTPPRKAVDPAAVASAAAQGISTETPAQLANASQ